MITFFIGLAIGYILRRRRKVKPYVIGDGDEIIYLD